MEIVGDLASLTIGISLGLIGGGGSILTVPVLIYLFNVQPIAATAYSLFIVGTTSLVGSFLKFQQREINLKAVIYFGVPSIAAVFATRRFILPAIPDKLLTVGHFELSKSVLMLILFAILMLVAAISMIRKTTTFPEEKIKHKQSDHPLLLVEGVFVGFVTGLVGAGGGFLIISALVFLLKLPIKQAVGSSLLIIAANSLVGFSGDVGKDFIDWRLLSTVALISIVGLFIGNALGKKMDGEVLRKLFGWLVLIMGVYIVLKELLFPILLLN